MLKPAAIGLYLAAATSVVNVVMDVCRKKALQGNDLISTTFWLRTFAAIGFSLAFLLRIHHLPGPLIHNGGAVFGLFGASWPALVKLLIYLLVGAGLVAAVQFFYLSALRDADISLSIPFMSFTPALLIPAGYVFLHEVPTKTQLVGVLLVVCGSLVMNRNAFRFGFLGPFWAILHQKGSRYMLICAMILAISNPIDKIIVLMSDPVTYGFCYGAMLCIIFAAAMLISGRGSLAALRRRWGWILIAGFLDALVVLLQFGAYSHLHVFLTITIKRAGIILSVFAGGIIFREKNIKDRLVAAITMLGGLILICVPISRTAQLLLTTMVLSLVAFWLRVTRIPRLGDETTGPGLLDGRFTEVGMRTGALAAPIPSAESVVFRAPDMAAGLTRVFRCALLGCGQIAQEYLGVYRDCDLVRVVACIDIDEPRAVAAAVFLSNTTKPGESIRASASLDDAMGDDVDIVVISTPNHLHKEHAIAALNMGKHVLLQKPLANSLQDALEIVQAARRHSTIAGIYMSYFDQPLLHDLRGMVEAGFFGTITQVHMKVMHAGGVTWSNQADAGNRSWRVSIEETGGGAFIQLAIHSIRTISWILSEEVTHVQGFATNRMCPGLEGEDSAVALLRFQSGTFATLNISWCASGEELAIHGAEGSLIYQDSHRVRVQSNHDYDGIVLHYRAAEEVTMECYAPALSAASQPFNQHRMFIESVRDGREPFVTVEDGLRDLAVVAAFYDSVGRGACVSVEPVADLMHMDTHAF